MTFSMIQSFSFHNFNVYFQVGLVGDDGVVRMVREVVDKEEREALEAAVVEEEARDKEAEASKDYTGLIPEVAFF